MGTTPSSEERIQLPNIVKSIIRYEKDSAHLDVIDIDVMQNESSISTLDQIITLIDYILLLKEPVATYNFL